MMTEGKQAVKSPQNQPRKSFRDRSWGTGSSNGSIHRTFQAVFLMPTIQTHKFLTRVCRRQYRNPIHLAMEWQRTIKLGEYSSPAALAYQFGIRHILAAQTNGKLERYHQSIKREMNQVPYELPGQLERAITDFVEYYNFRRYHKALGNVTPADVLHGRREQILQRRKEVQIQTVNHRKDYNQAFNKELVQATRS